MRDDSSSTIACILTLGINSKWEVQKLGKENNNNFIKGINSIWK